ncbi:MAG: tetratricopeptide repeat protein [Bryobacteraceae bacterium]|nr:tetratricopeptide repeat protein [Bryobacteraceae bacterium]
MRPVVLLLVSTVLSWAGADFGIRTRHSAKINISRPPDALLRGKNIVIKSRDGVAFRDRQALELAVERAMSGEYTPSKTAGDLVLTVAVASFEPVTAHTVTVTENRNVKVGTKPGKNIFTGKPTQVDDYQMRAVPVQYWEARGALGLQVTVHDAAGTLVDSFNPQGRYERKVETAENGVSKLKETLPTPQGLQTALIDKVASEIQARYTKTNEPVEVRLTVDDPLRAGNALAMSGQWKEALAAWTGAQMKKNPGDRAYNMAVAHEALAYQNYDASRNPDDAEQSFQQAITLYEEALRSDPGEKFFKQAQERCAKMKANFARAKDQYAAQQRTAEIEVAKAEARQKEEEAKRQQDEEVQKELTSTRADTQDEADFRTIARGRLKAVSGEVSADFQTKLVQYGKDAFKLAEVPSRRVVHQEIGRRQKLATNLELYKQTFTDLVSADKTLDAADRGALTRLAARLELGPEDVKPIEAQFEFADKTAPPAAPVPKATPPARAKPVQVSRPAAPKPPTPVVVAPKKSAVAPAVTPGIKK